MQTSNKNRVAGHTQTGAIPNVAAVVDLPRNNLHIFAVHFVAVDFVEESRIPIVMLVYAGSQQLEYRTLVLEYHVYVSCKQESYEKVSGSLGYGKEESRQTF